MVQREVQVLLKKCLCCCHVPKCKIQEVEEVQVLFDEVLVLVQRAKVQIEEVQVLSRKVLVLVQGVKVQFEEVLVWCNVLVCYCGALSSSWSLCGALGIAAIKFVSSFSQLLWNLSWLVEQ